ncbi:putative membrane protein SirB2 [Aeromonas sp. BIGb0405]|uniref:SirB2 family protein n=1 Tax=Aeromonas sp. BIGb0405 TaxID=2940592 RepID=UPI002166E7CF|nr:SirB2 family protein [Aeromonas sp. BIGb0405]MCS3457451.1 putative membrane protein SirB2 [Aeromonas sp. BIGb0405]
MIAYYPLLKHLHMTLAIVSILLFIYRWALAINESPRLQQRWLKIVPHLNDTLLLLAGIMLAVTLQMSPGAQPWLLAKLIALVVYIGLGVMALKRPDRKQKVIAGIAALLVFNYIIGVAVSKSPWAWFA